MVFTHCHYDENSFVDTNDGWFRPLAVVKFRPLCVGLYGRGLSFRAEYSEGRKMPMAALK